MLTFIFLNVLYPIGYSQPESPCDCIDPVPVGEDEDSETLVSEVNFIDNNCYLVHGTLIIDEATWFYNLRAPLRTVTRQFQPPFLKRDSFHFDWFLVLPFSIDLLDLYMKYSQEKELK